MNFVNLTPHAITVGQITIEPSGQEVRIFPTATPEHRIKGVECVINTFDEKAVEQVASQILEAFKVSGADYAIVSSFVLQAVAAHDVSNFCVAPDTSPPSAIRDEAGQIVGVKRFQVNPLHTKS